jgi:hypothetical protein
MVSSSGSGGAAMDVDEAENSPAVKLVNEELMTKTILLIQKSIAVSQPRLTARAVRQSVALRRYIKGVQVSNFVARDSFDRPCYAGVDLLLRR